MERLKIDKSQAEDDISQLLADKDRYRRRILYLENKNDHLNDEISENAIEINKYDADNQELKEFIKFLICVLVQDRQHLREQELLEALKEKFYARRGSGI